MADVTGLKARLVERAGVRVDRARELMADQVRTAAGPGLSPESVTTTVPTYVPPVWGTSLRVTSTVTTWQWMYGAREQRGTPFDPWHTELDTLTFDETNYLDILSKDPAEYPYGNHWWFPLDHRGCRCEIEIVSGDRPFPLTPDAKTIERAGLTVVVQEDRTVVAGGPPSWWSSTVTLENWRRALHEARP